jgi:putative flippase GtrA
VNRSRDCDETGSPSGVATALPSSHEFTKIIRFVGVGMLSAAVYALATALAISVLGADATLASAAGYAIAIPVNFVLQRSYSFNSKGALKVEAPKYSVVQGANLLLSAAAMAVVVEGLGLHYAYGMIAVIATIPILTYLAMNQWVFTRQQSR